MVDAIEQGDVIESLSIHRIGEEAERMPIFFRNFEGAQQRRRKEEKRR